jgi:MFS transporter, DHA1 family, inner membrane transport protein
MSADPSRSTKRLLNVVGLIVFATSLFVRAVDPVIPKIASDLWVEAATAALLSTAFALPYAILQPVLGPVADVMGKTRLMTICLVLLVATSVASSVATSFDVLLVLRALSGVVSGGIYPVSMALVADMVPINQRQVALSRILFAGMTGNLLGATASGIVGDLIGWRGVFLVLSAVGAIVLVVALLGFRGVTATHTPRVALRSVPANYRAIFANPHAKVCYGAVFLEGVFIFGVFPYVALLLLGGGEARASIAGIVIAGFWVGGVIYTLAVGNLLEMFGQRKVMIAGGSVAAIGLVVLAFGAGWPLALGAFIGIGLGFYLLHGSIQVYMTELSPHARAAATSLHSSSFFFGQALGPIVYGVAFGLIGFGPSLGGGALVVALVGVVTVKLLHDRTSAA